MGIKGLIPFIRENAPKAVSETTQQNYNGRVLAIDASTCLYQFMVAIRTGTGESYQNLTNDAGETTSHLNGFLNRTIRLLENGIKPVYVFDGKAPSLKSGELANRKAKKQQAIEDYEKAKEAGDAETMQKMADRSVSVTREMQEQTKRLLRLMAIPVVEAPCEAEATCAHLCKTGCAYAAATEDADALCFGAKKLIRNLFTTDVKKRPTLEVDLQRVLEQLDVDMEKFVDFCILSGCDYTDTISKVGSITAFQLIKQHGSIETVLEKAVDAGRVPANFPYQEARELFFKHEVTDVNEVDAATGKKKCDFRQYFVDKPKPDLEGLKTFMVNENQFDEKRVEKQLEKLKKLLGQGVQLSVDTFFTFEAAAIGSKDKFDPFKKKDGKKRANVAAGLAKASSAAAPSAKKRKGALTADKIEQQKKEDAEKGGNKGAAGSSSEAPGGLLQN
mmetsp:Transcript_4969/g.12452  ORF Transcript_4969/g.12452 Transcript_4969/m.12452 type:complete len:446 (-) Transcript_4969:226-1563(-)|eukprot:CAMPEP_0178995620 /NCGR_PEP_ID=MMETSP0795-20121207/7919_1 /TAXON_ID=88552 /ORGANISM="Amoebophrya sp., Strain Ameob2" /LENGTH=445 /DNA_ID=CAMNT_0020687929 /DNA_START=274 /DNA_END=1611 /DNA_ORIENTATION=-